MALCLGNCHVLTRERSSPSEFASAMDVLHTITPRAYTVLFSLRVVRRERAKYWIRRTTESRSSFKAQAQRWDSGRRTHYFVMGPHVLAAVSWSEHTLVRACVQLQQNDDMHTRNCRFLLTRELCSTARILGRSGGRAGTPTRLISGANPNPTFVPPEFTAYITLHYLNTLNAA